MPNYTYKCQCCGTTEERMRKISERNDGVFCDCKCNDPMLLIIEAPAFKMRESMEDRLNTNYEKKMQKKATGEW